MGTLPKMSTPKALLPTLAERLARARGDLRMGLPVVLEGAGVMVMAAESLTAARLEAARALGEPVLAVSAWRAETLKARAYDGDIARLTVPGDATADWVRGVADPAADLTQPLRGPYRSLRDGDAGPCRLAVALVKSARLLPAAVVVEGAVGDAGLTALPAELLAEALAAEAPIADVISARVPLSAAPSRVHVFRPGDGGDEHYGIEIGRPDRAGPVLVRLHSACFTGDVLGSLKCDCGAQLQGALAAMAGEGAGVLLYLNQEGRGIGLANKMRAYSLQDQGFDTVEANHRLGFEDDERDFRTGAAILKEMGITTIRLMTNNPAKVAMMEASGLTVAERVPLAVGRTPENTGYLDVKARKSGHLL